jgi:hypothetical protein
MKAPKPIDLASVAHKWLVEWHHFNVARIEDIIRSYRGTDAEASNNMGYANIEALRDVKIWGQRAWTQVNTRMLFRMQDNGTVRMEFDEARGHSWQGVFYALDKCHRASTSDHTVTELVDLQRKLQEHMDLVGQKYLADVEASTAKLLEPLRRMVSLLLKRNCSLGCVVVHSSWKSKMGGGTVFGKPVRFTDRNIVRVESLPSEGCFNEVDFDES